MTAPLDDMPPDAPDTGRSRLALAIERWRAARDRVAELELTQPRALTRRIQTRRARDDARHRAREEDTRQLVDALVSNTSEIAVGDEATKKAEADFELARRASDAIDRDLEEARTHLSWKALQRDQAIAMIIARSPELTELLQQHTAIRKRLYGIEAVLMLLHRKDAIPPTARGWSSIPDWDRRDFDPELRESWQRWLAELENDAEAALKDIKQ